MATVIGVFDNESDITKASDAIDKSGMGDDVVEVIDHGAPTSDTDSVAGVATAPAGSSSQGGAVVSAGDLPKGLADADLSSEEKHFFAQSLDNGARMIILDTDDVAKAKSVLQEHGASRVFPES